MGFGLKSLGNTFAGIATGGTSVLAGALGSSGGQNAGDAILSGIPFVGEGFAAQQQQNFSAHQAQKQMDFQSNMSSTAHQREVKDLKAAGLNPILSANSGASTPSGAMASGAFGSGAGNSAKLLENIQKKESDKAKSMISLQAANENLLKMKQETEKENKKLLSNSALKAQRDAEAVRLDNKTRQNEATLQESLGPTYKAIKDAGGLGALFKVFGKSSAKGAAKQGAKFKNKPYGNAIKRRNKLRKATKPRTTPIY